jgi:xanthine dehydrogenase iron-sulfur cluster and FAD-binding subunit A
MGGRQTMSAGCIGVPFEYIYVKLRMSGNNFSITINGDVHTIDLTTDVTVDADTSLAMFIRTKTNYRGTKIACAEGGCGACTVALTSIDVGTGLQVTKGMTLSATK